jgi:hypothetical protein
LKIVRDYLSARQRLGLQSLTRQVVHKLCQRIFPKRNDHNHDASDFDELIADLANYRVTTRAQLKRLLTKNRRTLMAMDKAPFDRFERLIYNDEYGEEVMREHYRRQFFFSYVGFVRNVIEIEFGEVVNATSVSPR